MDELRTAVPLDRANLPEEWLRSLRWIFRHYDFAVELCRAEVLTQYQRERMRACAREQRDYLLYLLVELEEIVNEKKGRVAK